MTPIDRPKPHSADTTAPAPAAPGSPRPPGGGLDIDAELHDWSARFAQEGQVREGRAFEDFEPAYRLGYTGHAPGRRFEDLEADLERQWERVKAGSRLAWSEAREAVRAAWARAENGGRAT